MLDQTPSPYQIRKVHRRSLAAHDQDVASTTAACLRFWRHRHHMADLPVAHLALFPQLSDPLQLSDWLATHATPAQRLHTRAHRVDDFVWWTGRGPGRFVVCQGEQPGVRLAYWDPLDGDYYWHALADFPHEPTSGLQDLVVRPARAGILASAPVMRHRSGWRAWLLGA